MYTLARLGISGRADQVQSQIRSISDPLSDHTFTGASWLTDGSAGLGRHWLVAESWRAISVDKRRYYAREILSSKVDLRFSGKVGNMTICPVLVPAAQYLRVSTDKQEYSLPFQTDEISKYAFQHGFSIVETYSDPAISGVLLRKRKGLQKLIHDVVEGKAPFRAVLVYDVSRWGRFQDTDESAHYEFLCKSAGVRVHYCAEIFSNDDNMSNLIMKCLKRAMAGEYSRELGAKVFAGQRRGAERGFRQGAAPGYGLRRLLVSSEGRPKQILGDGERKSIATDRVILVLGPESEVQWVHKIYEMFVEKRMTFSEIARELNRRRIPHLKGAPWSMRAVQLILTHPKYVGCNIYGRSTQRLYTRAALKPKSEWIVRPDSFEPIVNPKTYAKVQQMIQATNEAMPHNRSDDDLLDVLRGIYQKHGRITTNLLKSTSHSPSARTYHFRFGGLLKAYESVGYKGFWSGDWLQSRRRIQALRDELMRQIVEADPAHFSLQCPGGAYRTRICRIDGTLISVIASRPFLGHKSDIRWLLPRPDESQMITLVARLSLSLDKFKDMFVIPPVRGPIAVYLTETDPRLRKEWQLTDIGAFRDKLESLMPCTGTFPRYLLRTAK